MGAGNKSNEIHITRIYDAPVKAVWEAWVEPRQVAQWWGPRGFTLTTHSKDLKPGGHWHYTMHGPDGTDYPNKTKYLEVEPYSKLVYDHGGNDERAPLFRVTVVFSEEKGKTLMDMRMALPTPEAAKETRTFIKKAGGDGTWDRLAEYLSKERSGKEIFVITRSFDAPIELMFDMWTKPEHLTQWLPTTGFTMKYLRDDIRPGGSTFASWSNEMYSMHARAEYVEIKRPECIVYTQQFCDENEVLSRHPMAPTWPATKLTLVTFAAEGPDRTRVTITWEPYGECTAEELATFVGAKSGMSQGWGGSFDKLEEYLAAGDVFKQKQAMG